jgi:phage tail sheath protein FI
MYWPWIQIYDADLATRVWVPPSGLVSAKIAESDFRTAPWFAPAGLNRGVIVPALALEVNPNLGQRNMLYSGGNAINPIMKDSTAGIVIMGQRTLQRKATALDRVNARRTLLYLEKSIATAVRYLVFEPNDPTTWATFKALVNPVFESVKNQRGITDYEVIVDETTNDALARDRKEMNGLLKLKLTPAAEFITIDFALYSQGAKF